MVEARPEAALEAALSAALHAENQGAASGPQAALEAALEAQIHAKSEVDPEACPKWGSEPSKRCPSPKQDGAPELQFKSKTRAPALQDLTAVAVEDRAAAHVGRGGGQERQLKR